MHKLQVGPENISGKAIVITGDAHRHIAGALRKKTGDRLAVSCKGTDFKCEVKKICKRSTELVIISEGTESGEPETTVDLYQAVPKSDRMDHIIQKAVELGVRSVYPVITKRVIARPDQSRREARADRWNRIAKEAAQQCGRSVVPRVYDFIDFKDALNDAADSSLCLIPYEFEKNRRIRDLDLKDRPSISVFIGPEGGFEESEIETAVSLGAVLVTLGPRILRTDTAALAVLSILMHIKGEI